MPKQQKKDKTPENEGRKQSGMKTKQRKSKMDGNIEPNYRDEIALRVVVKLATDRLIETNRRPDFHRLVDTGFRVADAFLERR